MRILVYTPLFYPSIGGVEILVEMLVSNFSSKGHEVVVVSTTKGSGNRLLPFVIIESPSFIQLVKQYIHADIFFMPNISLKASWLFFINPFKKWVISHNTKYFDPETKNYLQSFIKQIFLVKAKNISVSYDIAKSLWVNSTVIHNCYNDKLFFNRGLTKKYTFLFVGRLVSSKGCNMLIEAFKKLKNTNRTITLAIVGDGPELGNLQRLVLSNKLIHESIFFLGFQPQEKVAEIMNMSLCLVVPSVGEEAFGIVVLEGLACGCELITSDSTGLIEANGGFGIIYPALNCSKLVEAMSVVINKSYYDPRNNIALEKYLFQRSKDQVATAYLNLFTGE